ncbi:MAG: flagellar biosynthesis anti-sigma factor FlgM [Deltaproteobacteria bacterium]|jgi:negative regulator of flagellin synthesis FlgM|nr:flagellar biosynthesis anti-sigma factor FlgM [Deltaproteobacteria bacterium]
MGRTGEIAMKIDANNHPLKIKSQELKTPAEKAAEAAALAGESSAKTVAGDKVNISERSKLIAKARELAASAPDVRSEKVADLTAKIAAGTYKVSSEQVADSIIRKSFNGIF